MYGATPPVADAEIDPFAEPALVGLAPVAETVIVGQGLGPPTVNVIAFEIPGQLLASFTETIYVPAARPTKLELVP